jgi:tetratricopeptide (TPR) repeat protein
LQQAIRLRPDMALAHYNLGYVLTHAHREQQAIASYKQALTLKPNILKRTTICPCFICIAGSDRWLWNNTICSNQ